MTSTSQATEPVVKTVSLRVTPRRAFELFTAHVGRWWPLATHSVSAQSAQVAAATCVFEPHVGGAFYELDVQGRRHVWGRVEVWEPGDRLIFTWHPGLPMEQATRVEVRFEAVSSGETRVVLVHGGWEARGGGAGAVRDQYESGWDSVLEDGLRVYVASSEHASQG